jgi:hypothetical protein
LSFSLPGGSYIINGKMNISSSDAFNVSCTLEAVKDGHIVYMDSTSTGGYLNGFLVNFLAVTLNAGGTVLWTCSGNPATTMIDTHVLVAMQVAGIN